MKQQKANTRMSDDMDSNRKNEHRPSKLQMPLGKQDS